MCEAFTAAFQAVLDEEAELQPLVLELRSLSTAMTSSFSFTRIDAIRKALRILVDLGGSRCVSRDGVVADAVSQSYCIAPPARSPSEASLQQGWEFTQRVLQRSNFASAIFHRTFPRRELLCQAPGLVLTEEEALSWSTLAVACRRPPPQQLANHGVSPQHPTTATIAASTDATALFEPLHAVTFAEQELALRLLQGVCLLCPGQKASVTESQLLPLFTETMMCLKQHIDATLRELLPLPGSPLRQDGSSVSTNLLASSAGGAADGVAASPLGVQPPLPHPSLSETLRSGTSTTRRTVVPLDPGLESVICAMIDAVEAACHYYPRSLASLVSTGGLKAALSVALHPSAPFLVRGAVLDMTSLLLQEIAPFRRLASHADASAGAAVSRAAATTAADTNALKAMLRAAVGEADYDPTASGGDDGGDWIAGGGPSRRHAAPASLLMDRASPSKFESALRDMLAHRNILAVLPQLTVLRDVKGTGISSSTPKMGVQRLLHRAARLHEQRLAEIIELIDNAHAVSPEGS